MLILSYTSGSCQAQLRDGRPVHVGPGHRKLLVDLRRSLMITRDVCCSWEFIVHLGFDLSIYRRKRPFKWPMVVRAHWSQAWSRVHGSL